MFNISFSRLAVRINEQNASQGRPEEGYRNQDKSRLENLETSTLCAFVVMAEWEGNATLVLDWMVLGAVFKVTGTLGVVDGSAFVVMRQVSELLVNHQTR